MILSEKMSVFGQGLGEGKDRSVTMDIRVYGGGGDDNQISDSKVECGQRGKQEREAMKK